MVSLIIYNAIIVFSFIFAYLAEHSDNKYHRLLCRLLCFLTLFIPAAIRYDIGTDFSSYVEYFNSKSSFEDYEPGFRFLNIFAKFLNLGSQSIFVFTSFLIYAPICFLLNRENYGLKILLYGLFFYLYSYNIIRNAIAISFLLVALDYYTTEKRSRWFVFFSLMLAMLFHYSVFFIIPFFIIDKIEIKFKVFFVLIIIALILVLNDTFFLLMSTSLFLDSKYSIYIGSVHSNATEIGSGIGVLINFIFPLFCVLFIGKFYSDKKYRILSYLIALYIMAYILALKISIFGRFSDLFSVSMILAIPICFDLIKSKIVFYIRIFLIMMLFVLFQKQIVSNVKHNPAGGHGIYPYETIFD